MMDALYYGGDITGDQPYSMTTGQGPNLNNAAAIEHELIVQPQIQAQQLLSPTQTYQHKRKDSLFSYSPSSGSRSSGPSPHQAEAQPYLPTAYMTQRTQMSNPAAMMRSGSQRSQRSTGSHQQGQYGQHRSSIGQGLDSSAVDMSRSSTRHSRTSLGYQPSQTAPQAYAAHPHAMPIGYSSWPTGYTLPATSASDFRSGRISTTAEIADSMYTFASDDARTLRTAELDGVGGIFSPADNIENVFGQESPIYK